MYVIGLREMEGDTILEIEKVIFSEKAATTKFLFCFLTDQPTHPHQLFFWSKNINLYLLSITESELCTC